MNLRLAHKGPPIMLANVLLAALLSALLAWNLSRLPVEYWLAPEFVLLIATTLVLIVLALRRGEPRHVDRRWGVRSLCFMSTFYVLLYERVPIDEDGWLTAFAYWGRLLFHNAAALALISLGKSYALLPAVRDMQFGFLYRWVRHPVYALHMGADLAFLGLQFSWWNLGIVWIAALMFVQRARFEEELLEKVDDYRAYQQRVPYRFIPYVI